MIRQLYHTLQVGFRPIRISGVGNTIEKQSKLGSKFLIRVVGNNNSIKIGKECLLTNTNINISGDDNHLIIEDNVRFMGPCKIIMTGSNFAYQMECRYSWC